MRGVECRDTLTLIRAIVSGGLVIGVLDLLDAFVFFGLRSGALADRDPSQHCGRLPRPRRRQGRRCADGDLGLLPLPRRVLHRSPVYVLVSRFDTVAAQAVADVRARFGVIV